MSQAGLLGFVLGAAGVTSLVAARYRRRACPPQARREPSHVLVGLIAGENRGPAPMSPPVALSDPYLWLRDDTRSRKDVLDHLKAENGFTQLVTAPLQTSVSTLYNELVSRLQETDADVPGRHGAFLYYTRTEKGKSYTLHCRAPAPSSPSPSTPPLPSESVILDENVLASGLDFCDLSSVEPSPDHSVICYTVDTSGYETYEVRFKPAAAPTVAARDLPKPSPTSSSASASSASPLSDVLTGSNGEVEWGADGSTVYYLTMDGAHRPHKLWRHAMGRPQSEDVLLFSEPDERFWLGMGKTRSGDFLVLDVASKVTSEVRLIPLTERGVRALVPAQTGGPPPPSEKPVAVAIGDAVVVAAREENVLYEVEHFRAPSGGGADDLLLILTNRGPSINFTLSACPVSRGGDRAAWREVIPHSDALYLTGFDVFERFVVLRGRSGGYTQVWMTRAESVLAAYAAREGAGAPATSDSASPSPYLPLYSLPPWDAVYSLHGSGRGNREYDTRAYRFVYGSPTTPQRTCEFAMDSLPPSPSVISGGGGGGVGGGVTPASAAHITVLKQKAVPNCDLSAYATRRVWATARDGTRVPISLVFRPSAHNMTMAQAQAQAASDGDGAACPFPSGPAPLFLYAYGSYGHPIDLSFSSSVLSLADRGVVYAVAHVRGGSEMGRAWYEREGKLLTKKNTFTDFIDCAEHLVGTGWTVKGAIACNGASAGGLLMGCVLNMRPDLWGAVLSDVGFVDVIQSVADPSIPLAVTEWEEWGNPNERAYFEYMSSYSPIDNVRPPAPRSAGGVAATVPLRFLQGLADTGMRGSSGGAGAGARAPSRSRVLPAVLRDGYACAYPPVLLTAGLNDSRVAYWEAAKFAARLRDAASVAGLSSAAAPKAAAPAAAAAVAAAAAAKAALEEADEESDAPSSMFEASGALRGLGVAGGGGGLLSTLLPSPHPGASILLKVDMGAGHFSYADRYVYLREKALEYAFVLDCLGVRV
jgi:oligopeptidase B